MLNFDHTKGTLATQKSRDVKCFEDFLPHHGLFNKSIYIFGMRLIRAIDLSTQNYLISLLGLELYIVCVSRGPAPYDNGLLQIS